MILKEQSNESTLQLPADRLSDEDRLERLFLGCRDRWRLLAVLNHDSGASRLLEPELDSLIPHFCKRRLLTRIVYLGYLNPERLDPSLRRWTYPNTRATGLDIHASRIVADEPLPNLRLFAPDNSLSYASIGFDTENGLDELAAILRDVLPE